MNCSLRELLKISLFLICPILSPHFLFGQSIELDSVVISTPTPSKSYQTQELSLDNPSQKLDEVIKNTTGVYVKDYGVGQLSSLSIRGTSASHTKLIWNGFDVSSATLGQSDFSLLPTFFVDDAQLNMGHGSLVDGVGGLGGNIQLNNQFSFNEGFIAKVEQSFGSFGLNQANALLGYSSDELSQKVRFWKQEARNDFSYNDLSVLGSPLVSLEHASLSQFGYQYDGGWKINSGNQLFGSFQYINSDRELPAIIGAKPSEQFQFDEKIRGYLGYKHLFNSSSITYKFGGFVDNFFYKDLSSSIFSPTQTASIQNRVDYNYYVKSSSMLVTFNTNHIHAKGDGIGSKSRSIYSVGGKWEQEISYFAYDITVREQLIDGEFSPLVYGLGVRYKLPFKSTLRSVASTNVRYPTINELYWRLGGDENLKKEKSNSYEIGIRNNYLKWMEIDVSYYQMEITDWIQWTPNSNGLWTPKNLREVISNGFTSNLALKYSTRSWELSNKLGYDFTSIIDLTDETSTSYKKQLIYVPKHKATYQLNIAYKNFMFTYDQSLTSQVFIDETNTAYLPAIYPANILLGYQLKLKKFEVNGSFQIKNIFNEPYQIVANRPMPGRNYLFTLGFLL